MADNGAHYHRTDLQVHTPRDNQWKGERPTSDSGRLAYGERFVAECRSRDLNAVAITDHHDFAFFPHIKRAAEQETDEAGNRLPAGKRLVVFPGLELTLGVPCQALLVFDADLPLDRLPDILSALSIDMTPDEEERLPSVTRLDHIRELSAVHDCLDLRDGLRGRFILLPNVTDKGHGTLMRSGMAAKYRDMPCVGGYLDGTVDKKVGAGNLNIFSGGDKARGNKPLSLFQTSDARSGTFEDLGEPSTWIKWSEPTAEALRQACLAEESRISHDFPAFPSVFIERISVSNSKFMGPIELSLNPQYNAIIGGRGTGKSSILGYLRWALCDQGPSDAGGSEATDHGARQERLIDATLRPFDSTVDVFFSLNEIPHVVRRSAANGELLLKIGEADFEPAQPADIRQLLPIQAYSQKQLSTVSVRLDELTSFVTMPIRRSLKDIDTRIRETGGRVRECYASLQRYRLLDQNVRMMTTQVQSLTDQAEQLRNGLTGLSDDDREVLNAKQQSDGIGSTKVSWDERWERSAAVVDRFDGVLTEQMDSVHEVPGSGPEFGTKLVDYQTQLKSALSALQTDVRVAVDRFAQSRAGVANLGADIVALLSAFEERYELVKARSTVHSSRLAELAELESEREASERSLRQETSERDDLGDPASDLTAFRQNLMELTIERSEAVEAQCERLSELSEGLIRASLRRGQGLRGAQDAFRGFAPNSGLRGAKIENLFEQLAAEEDPLQTWIVVLTELEALASMPEDAEVTTEAAPTTARLGFSSSDLARIVKKGTPDGWLSLALTPVEDHPIFQYRTRESDYIDFVDASAGQQATALMRVLLAEAGPPLIIDQPEDDLDSQVVQDIVGRLWTAKAQRQLVFASHNANLVVNGDADLVVVCDYRIAGDQSGGRIKAEGAIDRSDVRDEITVVMEGGEKAFRLRKEKYGF